MRSLQTAVVQAIGAEVLPCQIARRVHFSDALAAVRFRLWSEMTFSLSAHDGEITKLPGAGLNRLIQAVYFPA